MRNDVEKSSEGRSGFRFGLHTAIALAVLSVIVCAAVVLLSRFNLTGASSAALNSPAPELSSGAPMLTAEPENTPEPTAAPTPAPTATPTPSSSYYVKTAVIIDGKETVVLASRQAAEEVVNAARNYYANQIELLWPGAGAATEIMNSVSFVVASTGAETTDFDTAKAYLTGEDSPLLIESHFARRETEAIPHGSIESSSSAYYVGTRFVASYGRDGKKLTVYEYTYSNKAEPKIEIAQEIVLCEPIDERVLIGTRPIPEDVADGSFGADDCPATTLVFASPVPGAQVTRYFGFYGGVLHRGVDLACDEGTACLAAESGVVIAVIERGALGMTVEIDHGGGFVTRYATLGEAGVSVGDSVSKGQPIGTASVSGVHFEIIAGGRPRNPLVYISADGEN